MIQEIPYAIYIDTSSNNMSLNNITLTDIPLSVEIVPHKAILVHDVIIPRSINRTIPNSYKYCIVFFASVPISLVLMSFFIRMP